MILDSGSCLNLEKCLYVFVCTRNLIFVGKFENFGFKIRIDNGYVSFYKNMYYYYSSTLIDNLHCFNIDVKFVESLFHVEHNNHIVCKEKFSFL